MVDVKNKYNYLTDMIKCNDGRMRRAFRIPGKGQTVFVMCNGLPIKSKEIKHKDINSKSNHVNESVICFTAGPNKSNSQYTPEEFLALIKTLNLCSVDCPTDLQGWLDYTGAIIKTKSECAKIDKNNKQMVKNVKKVSVAEDALDECMETSICSRKHAAWKEMNISCEFPTHRGSAKCAAITCPSEVGKLAKAHKAWSKVSGSQTWYTEPAKKT